MTNPDTYEPCEACDQAEAVTLTAEGAYLCGSCEHLSPKQARRLAEKMA